MKSLHVKLNEALEKMTSKQRDKFFASRKNGSPVEAQLNCAEAILDGKVKEAAPIVKHNGAHDNFVESNPWNSQRERFSEGATKEKTAAQREYEKSNKLMADAWLKQGKITEAEHHQIVIGKPVGYQELSEKQQKEFDFCRSIGITEADAFRVVKGSNRIFSEVSR